MPVPGLAEALSPIEGEDRPPETQAVEAGPALSLSGGGFRAMLFHAGCLIRLNEARLLGAMKRISCVSGGSITGGMLGLRWGALNFQGGTATNLEPEVLAPIRRLAGKTIDRGAIVGGLLLPGEVWERVRDAYRENLFGDATLQDLPTGDPRIVLNATNVQSGALWRFMKPYMRDWKVGEYKNPTVLLATAVAASSAFPPVLSPVKLKLDADKFTARSWLPEFEDSGFREEVVLSDGGVYDNLGLETVWKRYEQVFVSDGGGKLAPELEPHADWARHGLRINGLIDSQVRALRKRQVVGSLEAKLKTGAYWSIHTDPQEPGWAPHFPLPANRDRARELSSTPTRLARLEPKYQERLMNWGYAVASAALSRFWTPPAPLPPAALPYPASGI
jgi:NTE family protein